MKKLVLMSALLLALTGCMGMPMGDEGSNDGFGSGGFGGMDGGGGGEGGGDD